MSKQLTLLCVHGVSHSEIDPEFRTSWTKAIRSAMQSCDPEIKLEIDFLEYDDLFDKAPLNLVTYSVALGKLLVSAAVHSVGDALPGGPRHKRHSADHQVDGGHGRAVVDGRRIAGKIARDGFGENAFEVLRRRACA
jgi:hypothetical protein